MTDKEFFIQMHSIAYGYYDRINHRTYAGTDLDRINNKTLLTNCNVLTPKEVWKYKVGTCFDQSLLEVATLPHCKDVQTVQMFFFCYYTEYYANHQLYGNMSTCHSGVVYNKENKWFYFEHAWGNKRGIYGPYMTSEEALEIANNFGKEDRQDKKAKYEFLPNCDYTPLLKLDTIPYLTFIEVITRKSKVNYSETIKHWLNN